MQPRKTASGRRYCRICSGLAGMTHDVCHGCRSFDVGMKLAEVDAPPKPPSEVVQQAYAQSLQDIPMVGRPVKRQPVAGFAMAGAATQGAQQQSWGPRQRLVLADAQGFAATMCCVPANSHAAELFFSYSRRGFYQHVRALLKTLDVRKRVGKRKRQPSQRRRENVQASKPENRALSQALRLIRLYMQEEIVALALKLDCSKSQVWHLEIAENVVQHRWVERYAKVFGFETTAIYSFASALATGPSWEGCPKDMLRKFHEHLLCPATFQPASKPEHALSVAKLQEVSGAVLITPRPRAGKPRVAAGTGLPMNKALGEALRYFRMARDMQVPYFAASAEISESHIYNLERDRRAIGKHWVEKYAKVLRCDAGHIWAFADVLFDAGPDANADWLRTQYEEICTAPDA